MYSFLAITIFKNFAKNANSGKMVVVKSPHSVKLVWRQNGVYVFYASASVGAFFYFYKGEVTMPDYKTMYAKLFNAITDAVEILQQAQRDTEEMYIESGEKESLRTLDLQIIKGKEKKK